ncbi:5-methyltetrahydropteroyltriglutamate--homocysteine S-methyltransferase [Streptomyces sp. ODS28]|uniref:5-methyltetrahydropteroyltriglutamate-- homocysteine S-methyltransferase n=1 Tax=Streptomyces sp. ODS28 TaxID=3136688 RepID=UPI0031E57949
MSRVHATSHGYPRQGAHRRLKKAVEGYWHGDVSRPQLLEAAAELRAEARAEQAAAGIEEIPTGHFSLYDHVLDTAWMTGAIPERHRKATEGLGELDAYFAMARGTAEAEPLEMTKWFDTNYHYLVPELSADSTFAPDSRKQAQEFTEARREGRGARPVLLGPVTFLLLSKPAPGTDPDFDPLTLLDRLLPVYASVLADLRAAGAGWVQLDEPALVQEQPEAVLNAASRAYRELCAAADRPKLLVASYFDRLGDALRVLADSPVEGLAMDFTGPAAANLEALAHTGGLPGRRLIAGVVDGRNVWAADLERLTGQLATLLGLAGQLDVAPSCSLLHVPLDVTLERDLDPQVARWLAFARQKCAEVALLAKALTEGRGAVSGELSARRAALSSRAGSSLVRDAAVRARTEAVTGEDSRRAQSYPERAAAQRARLRLPPLPTTTIGSFPQTGSLRRARAGLRKGELTRAEYDARIAEEIREVISVQEDAGLDVLVHGEPERNDMVQFFAERLSGYLATQHGWVQSYGTRYVRPPILAGDVSRPGPMTLEWTRFAQSLTDKPVKGMLTGPVTMLSWSFVRDDQPLAETARQVALALRDEVADLEAAGTAVIQVDEPALRELLPLRAAARPAYLEWATEAFRLATSGVRADTQIHTHMCYAEFGEILGGIEALDADVISLEAARSHMAVAAELSESGYPREAGPGVYDIHSPRVPGTEEIAGLLRRALAAVPRDRLWVNPDCGLKTRSTEQVEEALSHMTEAARAVRAGLD